VVDWGVPDWRDGSAYPSRPEDFTDLEWWWEFTRRNLEYREIWLRHCPRGEQSISLQPETYAFMHHRLKLTRLADPRRRFEDGRLHWMKAPRVFLEPFEDGRQRQAGADAMLEGTASAETLVRFAAERDNRRTDLGLCRIAFDLTKPLTPQLEETKRVLEHQKVRRDLEAASPKPRQHGWANFLRVLDARDAGASLSQIAAVLWPDQEKTPGSARDTFEAACRLRDNFPL
jgi:hypothetical protein